MEKLKWKTWMLASVMSIGILGANQSFAKDDKVKLSENNRLIYRKEYKDMKSTLERIDDDKKRIKTHRGELKANKKAKKTIPAHMSKKELKKAKADLRRDKKHLRADRKDLKADQKVAIKKSKDQLQACSKELRKAKQDLRKDLRKGKTYNLTAHAQKVDYLTWRKEQLYNLTASLEYDVHEFFVFLDDEIDQAV